ncbi:MAG: Holliday junction resolvase RuvX [Woeseiaceae bacterium]
MPDTPDTIGPETILAFDYGRRRIGVAVGQTVTASASPLGVVGNDYTGPDQAKIDALIREWRPNRLVVGMPAHADGSSSDMQDYVNQFIAELATYQLPVETVDERYTSVEAEAELKKARVAGTRGRISKEEIDSAAAVLIAERYLAARND